MEAALRYADDGWQVFPLHGIENGKCTCGVKCSSPGKHPRVNWSTEATDDFGKVTEWWKRWPNANVGVATGMRSGIYVIDVDNKDSVDLGGGTLIGSGDHSLKLKQAEIGKLPDTRSSTTGSGGTHLVFAYPSDQDAIAGGMGNRGGLLFSVDTRGDGGYIVAPPSMHQSGNRYRWNDPDQPLSLPPKTWLDFIATASGGDKSPLTPSTDFVIQAGEGRHEWLFRVGANLRGQHGLDYVPLYGALMAYNSHHCRPPISPQDIEHIVQNCMKYEAGTDGVLGASVPRLLEGDDLAELLFDFMQDEPAPFKELVNSLLHSGEAMIIGGPPNVGKTWVVMDMMLGIAQGGYFANHFSCSAAPVLFIDEEGSRRGDWERFNMLLGGRGDMSSSGIPLYAKIDAGVRLDTERGHTQLGRLIERYKPGAVFLDSLVRVHGGQESDNRAMADFFRLVKRLQVNYECAFIFTHHIRKPGKDAQEDPLWILRGASDIQGYPDSILIIMPGENSSEVKVIHTKMRNAEKQRNFRLHLKIDDVAGTAAIAHYEDDGDPVDTGNAARDEIMAILVSGKVKMTTMDIAMATGLSQRTVIDHCQVLAGAGLITTMKDMEGVWWHQTIGGKS
jgi:hypothetical protein